MCSAKEASTCSQAWLRAQLVHLEDRYPSFLNECVHLLNVGCLCATLTLYHDEFLNVNHLAPIACGVAMRAKPKFPRRHPILSPLRVLAWPPPSTHVLQGWEATMHHNLPASVM